MVALSESVKKNLLKHPLADKSRWRHILLAIKPRYLRNHASQIKSYYGTLSGSHGRFFRIRHKKLRAVPPSGEIPMTSYPVGNETSLSRKPCIPDEKLLWNAIRKSWSLFLNFATMMVALSESIIKICLKRPLAKKSRWRHIRLAIKSRYLGNHASQIKSYYGTLWGSHGRSFRIHQEKLPEAPPGGEIAMTWYLICNKSS